MAAAFENTPVAKRLSKRSCVFEHFILSTNGNHYVCQCIIGDSKKTCDAKISSFGGSNKNVSTRASNLKRHLQRFHSQVFEAVKEKDKNSIPSTSGIKKDQKPNGGQTKLPGTSKSGKVTLTMTPEKFKDHIVEMTVNSCLPLTLFSQPAFLGLHGEMARKLGISLEPENIRRLILEETKLPDLSERIGMEGSPMTSKMESGSSYLTCSPLLSGMPGIHEDPMPVAGPSSSSHDQQEEILPPEYDQEEIEVKSEPIFRASSEICEDDNSQNNTQSSSDRPSSHSSPTSGMTGPYLLKKETHCSTILDQLLRDDTFSDVTLTAEGQSIKAHKIVLCLASAYFRQVLSKESSVQNVIVFRDIKFSELRNLINFIYTGEATVDAAELESFMRTAEMLEVNSLCEGHRTLPKNLIPKSKEAEPEKTKLSSGSSKRSHSSMVASPPMKTRRIVSTDSSPSSKISKVATYPSTSTEGGSVPPPTTSSATYPTCVIKSEPPSDEGEEREFCPRVDENKGLPETSMESPRHYEEPDQSPPLDRIDDLPEKVPLGKCPFCPNPQQQPSLFGSSLTNHVHLCHPEKTAFPCDICSRVFLKKRSFEAHKEDCIR